VRGGGIEKEHEAVLSFDGTTYPTNPSLPPAKGMTNARGKEIITDRNDSVPLYE
jgi:hypothetical protein